jgi:hypothetical protein
MEKPVKVLGNFSVFKTDIRGWYGVVNELSGECRYFRSPVSKMSEHSLMPHFMEPEEYKIKREQDKRFAERTQEAIDAALFVLMSGLNDEHTKQVYRKRLTKALRG